MKAYINNLNEREKWMVLTAVLSVIIYIYYMFIYSPLATSVEERSEQLIEKTATLEWMKKAQHQKSNVSKKQSVDNSQLLIMLSTQLKNSTTLKFPYQLQQTSSGEIQLSFEQVPFNDFIEWLLQINRQYNVNIKQLDANKTATPGLARLMMILSAS